MTGRNFLPGSARDRNAATSLDASRTPAMSDVGQSRSIPARIEAMPSGKDTVCVHIVSAVCAA